MLPPGPTAIVLPNLLGVDSRSELARPSPPPTQRANWTTPRSLARAQQMSGPREVLRKLEYNPKSNYAHRDLRFAALPRRTPISTWADCGSNFRTPLLQLPFEPPFQRFCSSKNFLVSKAPAGVAIPTRIDRAIIANTVVFMALSPPMKKVRGKITLLWCFV